MDMESNDFCKAKIFVKIIQVCFETNNCMHKKRSISASPVTIFNPMLHIQYFCDKSRTPTRQFTGNILKAVSIKDKFSDRIKRQLILHYESSTFDHKYIYLILSTCNYFFINPEGVSDWYSGIPSAKVASLSS